MSSTLIFKSLYSWEESFWSLWIGLDLCPKFFWHLLMCTDNFCFCLYCCILHLFYTFPGVDRWWWSENIICTWSYVLSKEAIFHRVNLKMENFTLYMRRKGRTLTPSPNCKFAKGEEKTIWVHLSVPKVTTQNSQIALERLSSVGSTVCFLVASHLS